MSLLDHLDELRSRLLRILLVLILLLAACWGFSGWILAFLLDPVRHHLPPDQDLAFIHITEPFITYMKAAAIAAVFLASPFILYQLWAFVTPGLYRHERRMVIPFLVFGTLFFVAGGAFGYAVATPVAARWLIDLGQDYQSSVRLQSAFQFVSRIVLGMGAVFELPILIFFLSRIGVVTPGMLIRQFRLAVLVIAALAAVITPTGDVLTMSIFAGPMVLLYLFGVLVSWLFGKRPVPQTEP